METMTCSKCGAKATIDDRNKNIVYASCTCKAPFYVDATTVAKRPRK